MNVREGGPRVRLRRWLSAASVAPRRAGLKTAVLPASRLPEGSDPGWRPQATGPRRRAGSRNQGSVGENRSAKVHCTIATSVFTE